LSILTAPTCFFADAGNQAVTLYNGGSAKLATTATGIDVTGTATMDGLTVDTNSTLGQTIHNTSGGSIYTRYQNNSGNDNYIGYTNNNFDVFPNNSKALTVASGGDISFYEDTGTTAKFFWDASAEFLGIGTTSPSAVIDARQTFTGGSTQLRIYNTDNTNTTTQTAALFLSPDSRGNGALIYAEKENADFSTSAGRDVALVFSPVLNNTQTERHPHRLQWQCWYWY
jgi:hypothetical protein